MESRLAVNRSYSGGLGPQVFHSTAVSFPFLMFVGSSKGDYPVIETPTVKLFENGRLGCAIAYGILAEHCPH